MCALLLLLYLLHLLLLQINGYCIFNLYGNDINYIVLRFWPLHNHEHEHIYAVWKMEKDRKVLKILMCLAPKEKLCTNYEI